MRIAFFTNCYKPLINGVVTSISSLKEAYERKGHEVYVFAPKVEDYVDQEKNVFRYRSVNLTTKVKYPLPIPLSFRVKKVITEFNPDIVHIHHPFLLSSVAIMYGKRLGIPKILTIHTQYEQYAYYVSPVPERVTHEAIKMIISNLAYKTDCITTPSASMKELIEGYGIKNRIEVIPNAIHLISFKEDNELKRTEIKRKYNLKEDDKIILFVGRIASEKSIDKLIKALAIIKKRNNGKEKLLIVGNGPAMDELKQLTQSLKVEEDVIFTGTVSYEEIQHYYKMAYVFTIASTTETFGIVTIEALASGTPVLAIKAPGAVDILTDGLDGLLVDDDVEKFANALEKIIREPELREKLSRGALKTSEKYSINTISERMLNLYREAIKKKKSETKEKKNFIKDILAINYEGKVKNEK
ncbi:MAG: glycosyltransferase family 4 protein [Candidatus Caldatribacteriota bacterium]|nr:glycosyltransferase family 4 protein [Candidatus Caldatribacteriota bacterium]